MSLGHPCPSKPPRHFLKPRSILMQMYRSSSMAPSTPSWQPQVTKSGGSEGGGGGDGGGAGGDGGGCGVNALPFVISGVDSTWKPKIYVALSASVSPPLWGASRKELVLLARSEFANFILMVRRAGSGTAMFAYVISGGGSYPTTAGMMVPPTMSLVSAIACGVATPEISCDIVSITAVSLKSLRDPGLVHKSWSCSTSGNIWGDALNRRMAARPLKSAADAHPSSDTLG
mmetsp:Transcript_63525/g.169315  ORF Transcript_63525/g.169315 Transcript_63525/m.169315 type:complete len:230 (-) Transcript_63525:255-944(-)